MGMLDWYRCYIILYLLAINTVFSSIFAKSIISKSIYSFSSPAFSYSSYTVFSSMNSRKVFRLTSSYSSDSEITSWISMLEGFSVVVEDHQGIHSFKGAPLVWFSFLINYWNILVSSWVRVRSSVWSSSSLAKRSWRRSSDIKPESKEISLQNWSYLPEEEFSSSSLSSSLLFLYKTFYICLIFFWSVTLSAFKFASTCY